MHERAPLQNPTVADPSRTADVDEGEGERDDEMSEPTHMVKAEKRKEDSDGRNCERVTGTVAYSSFVTCEFIET